MQPILLKMTAFGPYAKETILDFTLLGGQQMFVITGPTGAGKTTIFDAMCYALFGETSIDERQGKGLCSDFVTLDNHLTTIVEFTFKVRGKTYFIKRQPPQLLPKRGGGWKDGVQEAEFHCVDHEAFAPLTRLGEVNSKVEEVLGLNSAQFRKIVMIPQGDFRRFLSADTKEKGEILRKLFGTTFFEQLQEKLSLETRSIKAVCDGQQILLGEKLRNIQCDNHEQLIKGLADNVDTEEVMLLLKAAIETDRENCQTSQEKIKVFQENLEKINQDLVKGGQINQLHQQLLQAEAEQKALQAKNGEMEAKRENLAFIYQAQKLKIYDESLAIHQKNVQQLLGEDERLKTLFAQGEVKLAQLETLWQNLKQQQGEIETAKKRQVLLKSYVDDVEQLKVLSEQLNMAQISREEAIKNLTALEKAISENTNLRQALEEQLNRFHVIQQEEIKLAHELSQIEHDGKEAAKRLERIITLIEIKGKIPDVEISVQKAADQLLQEQKQLADLRRSQLEQYRAKLASELVIGEPCPICGNKVLTIKANQDETLVAQGDIERQEEIVNQQQSQLEKLKSQRELLNSDFQKELKALVQEEGFATKDGIPDLAAWQQEAESQRKELQKLYRTTKQQREEILKEIERLKDASKQKNLAEAEKNVLEQKINAARSHQLHAETEFSRNDSLYQELLRRIPKEYHQPQKLQQEIALLEKRVNSYQKEWDGAQKAYNEQQNYLEKLKGQLESVKRQLSESQLKFNQSQEALLLAIGEHFESEEHYRQYQALIPRLENYQKEIHDFDSALKSNAAQICAIMKQLNHQPKIDMESLEKKKQEITIFLTQEQKSYNAVYYRWEHNRQIYEEIQDLLQWVKASEKQYQISARLSKLANGDNSWRMTFETFVLVTYFEKILFEANKRLEKMTGGRYYFKRQQQLSSRQRKAGLDLDIMDNYTGKTRAVATLSGGEGFKASLALALGLSDVVQQSVGGIELNTIFIDEGFGTLDAESLETTIDCLIELQLGGRLVGIISHVAELKERIKAQLVVTPSEKGSQAVFKIN